MRDYKPRFGLKEMPQVVSQLREALRQGSLTIWPSTGKLPHSPGIASGERLRTGFRQVCPFPSYTQYSFRPWP